MAARCKVLVMNIDLRFRGTPNVMYLVATLNDDQWRERMKWKIHCFLTAQQIRCRFGIEEHELPRSSRAPLMEQLEFPPIPQNLPQRVAMDMVRRTRFQSLCGKNSKRRKCTVCADGGGRKCTLFVLRDDGGGHRVCRCGHSAADHGIHSTEQLHPTLRVHPRDLKRIVLRHWSDDTASFVPVVVNQPRRTWIEWKKLIHFRPHRNGQWLCFAISLCFDEGRWRIKCMDYDAGRVFYQHRLITEWVPPKYRWTYSQLARCINIKLQIDHRAKRLNPL